jgi:hypothetical protein
MPKNIRGLPKDFELNVPVSAPVELGDYLDDSPLPAGKRQTVDPVSEPNPLAWTPVPDRPNVQLDSPSAHVPGPRIDPEAPTSSKRPAVPPRKQFNMTPETLRMVDELLIHIRNNSAERDVRASELFHALVLAIHEVRPLLDLSRIPTRGRWGSPQAAALPIALKEAFQDAMARLRGRR